MADVSQRRCGFIALIGAPNAGKSTLLNALVGAKVSIVSRKVQTTRVPLRGIAIEGDSQLVFIDTPGIFQPRRRLDRAMVDAATGVAGDADIVALLVDAAKGATDEVDAILGQLRPIDEGRRILILNKVDRVEKPTLLGLAQEIHKRLPFSATFMISAITGSGVDALKRHLAKSVPEGPWHYPEDEITDATERSTAAEVTREKIYEYLHEELPYQTTVETTGWEEKKDGSVRIEQTVFVAREGQRRIVLGEGGHGIKKISMASRHELARMLGRPVHLFLHVKLAEGWENDPERYREMGLEFPRKK
ncbi:MAG: GTPase Era [Hyphomicrobiaceae bacterium]|nr:GTPase Era [Hyphomicrobiaceae bacterium]